MCTNRALVETLECYMDDLVGCFEDFVKKSLILITVGVATVVFILLYMLKVVSERTDPNVTASASSLRRQSSNAGSLTSYIPKSSSERDNIHNDYLKEHRKPSTTTCRSENIPPRSTKSSLQTLASKTSCKKNCGELKKKTSSKSSTSRLPIPSLSSCMIKQHLSPRPSRNRARLPNQTSCCSMCCSDEKS